MAAGKVTEGVHAPRDGEGGLVRVGRVSGGTVAFHPEGGGFARTMPEARFAEGYRAVGPEELARRDAAWRRTWVRGDWFADGAEAMPAWGNGRLWNGFEMPMFERDALLAAIADGRLSGAGLAGLHHLPDSDAFLLVEGDGGELPAYDPAAMARLAAAGATEAAVGGDKVYLSLHAPVAIVTPDGPACAYGIGSGGWCWCAAEEPEPAGPRP